MFVAKAILHIITAYAKETHAIILALPNLATNFPEIGMVINCPNGNINNIVPN